MQFPRFTHRRRPRSSRDEDDFIARVLKEAPDLLKALEAQYEIALTRLLERGLDPSGPDDQRLVRRLTRHFLFNYFFGFLYFKFTPAYKATTSDNEFTTNRQRHLERGLQQLTRFDASRQMMTEYFRGALKRRVHALWRDYLNAHKLTINPGRMWIRTVVRSGLADDWEKLSDHGITFGLNGFYLLFEAAPTCIPPDEFAALFEYARRLARKSDWTGIRDVFHILCQARLSAAQESQLLEFVHSILDESEYPYTEPEDEGPDALLKSMGLSPLMRRVLGGVIKVVERQTKASAEFSRNMRSTRQYHALLRRKEEAARILGILSQQSDQALKLLQDLNSEASGLLQMESYNDRSYEVRRQFLETSLESLLIASVNHVSALEALFHMVAHGSGGALSDKTFEALRESGQRLEEEPAEDLLEATRAKSNNRLAEQILANVSGLMPLAVERLAAIVATEDDLDVLTLLSRLCLRLRDMEQNTTQILPLQNGLAARLQALVFDIRVALRPEWMSFLAGATNGGEPLRKVLGRVAQLGREGHIIFPFRCVNILDTLASVPEQLPKPNAIVLAACWWAVPTKPVGEDRFLLDRLCEAEYFLGHPTERWVAERTVEILDSAIDLYPQARRAIAQALRTLNYPDLACPLLERLMDIAAVQLSEAARQLYCEALKSVAALKPLTPRTLTALQNGLLSDKRDFFTPKFVYEELLPLLAHEVSSEVIEPLMQLIWQSHCPVCGQAEYHDAAQRRSPFARSFQEAIHRYFHPEYQYESEGLLLFCALQSLANTSCLSPSQQGLIERLYRTSWLASVKGLCLLILSRQRPAQERTILLMDRLLRAGPYWSMLQALFTSILRKRFQEYAPNADEGYIFLCQSVAVYALSILLQETPNPVVTKHRERIEKALLIPVSIPRYLQEARLIEHAMLGTGRPAAEAMRQFITPAPGADEPQKPTWVAHPSDIAYEVISDLWWKGLFKAT